MVNYTFYGTSTKNLGVKSITVNDLVLRQDSKFKRDFILLENALWGIPVVEGTHRFEFSAPQADLDIELTNPEWSLIDAIYRKLKYYSGNSNDFEIPEGLTINQNGTIEVMTGS